MSEIYILSPSLSSVLRTQGVRAILPLTDTALLAAGTDGAVRHWDAARPENCYVVLAPPPPPAVPAEVLRSAGVGEADLWPNRPRLVRRPRYSVLHCGSVQVLQELPGQPEPAAAGAAGGAGAGSQQQQAAQAAAGARAECHRDAILAMASAAQGAQRMLLTAGRDGVVKAWR